jgi:hypothetical protein
MRSHNLTSDVGSAMRVAAVVLGMIALAVPSSVLIGSDDAFAADGKNDSRHGTQTPNGKSAANADAGFGIFSILFAGTGGANFTGSGADAYASGPAGPPPHNTVPGGVAGGDRGIAATFESLSRQQQDRVMQRCKDVLAAPAHAVDANQVSLCQTLNLMAGR